MHLQHTPPISINNLHKCSTDVDVREEATLNGEPGGGGVDSNGVQRISCHSLDMPNHLSGGKNEPKHKLAVPTNLI